MERAYRHWLVRQNWLDSVSERVQGVVAQQMQDLGLRVTDILHGTWLRHPLHPALTDVPIGAWSAAAVMDLVGLAGDEKNPPLARGADAALAVGIAGAAAAAAAGLADWRWVFGHPRRTGLIHAALNTTALLLNTISLACRLSGDRQRGVALSTAAYGSLLFSAWLGGDLVYEDGIGIDHTAFQQGPRSFVPVMKEGDLPEGQPHRVEASGVPVMLLRRGDQIYAIAHTCSHQGGPLSSGTLADHTITCPWHHSQFDAVDGSLIHGPSTFDQPRYETRVRDGQIEVRLAVGSK